MEYHKARRNTDSFQVSTEQDIALFRTKMQILTGERQKIHTRFHYVQKKSNTVHYKVNTSINFLHNQAQSRMHDRNEDYFHTSCHKKK
jgi:hypothetical protein